MPVLVFGEGAGMIGGDHKDTWIRGSVTDKANAGSSLFDVADLNGADNRFALVRLSLVNHIPINDIVNSAILTLTLNSNASQTTTQNIYRLNKAFGISPTNEGPTESPATRGQGTYRRSFDLNGAGGDIPGYLYLADKATVHIAIIAV